MHHNLKTWPHYFEMVLSGQKTFEVRENDRQFKEGDTVRLYEFTEHGEDYTGRVSLLYRIGSIVSLDPFTDNYRNMVVFSLLPDSVSQ